MIELAIKLGLPEETIEKLRQIISDKGDKINKCADECIASGFSRLKFKDPLFRLAVILRLACDVKKKYDKAGIDEKIYYDKCDNGLPIYMLVNDNIYKNKKQAYFD